MKKVKVGLISYEGGGTNKLFAIAIFNHGTCTHYLYGKHVLKNTICNFGQSSMLQVPEYLEAVICGSPESFWTDFLRKGSNHMIKFSDIKEMDEKEAMEQFLLLSKEEKLLTNGD